MQSTNHRMYPSLEGYISDIQKVAIPQDRREKLAILIDYIRSRKEAGQPIHLNFICTHNSRRSQFSQVWAHMAGVHFGMDAHCYSGGVEVTACNEKTIKALSRAGFHISSEGVDNPHYTARYTPQESNGILLFSKLYDDPINPVNSFAAVMTCAEADNNCPYIPGVEQRISITYEDPKVSDDSPHEHQIYDERCRQIASEMFYVFSQIKST